MNINWGSEEQEPSEKVESALESVKSAGTKRRNQKRKVVVSSVATVAVAALVFTSLPNGELNPIKEGTPTTELNASLVSKATNKAFEAMQIQGTLSWTETHKTNNGTGETKPTEKNEWSIDSNNSAVIKSYNIYEDGHENNIFIASYNSSNGQTLNCTTRFNPTPPFYDCSVSPSVTLSEYNPFSIKNDYPRTYSLLKVAAQDHPESISAAESGFNGIKTWTLTLKEVTEMRQDSNASQEQKIVKQETVEKIFIDQSTGYILHEEYISSEINNQDVFLSTEGKSNKVIRSGSIDYTNYSHLDENLSSEKLDVTKQIAPENIKPSPTGNKVDERNSMNEMEFLKDKFKNYPQPRLNGFTINENWLGSGSYFDSEEEFVPPCWDGTNPNNTDTTQALYSTGREGIRSFTIETLDKNTCKTNLPNAEKIAKANNAYHKDDITKMQISSGVFVGEEIKIWNLPTNWATDSFEEGTYAIIENDKYLVIIKGFITKQELQELTNSFQIN